MLYEYGMFLGVNDRSEDTDKGRSIFFCALICFVKGKANSTAKQRKVKNPKKRD